MSDHAGAGAWSTLPEANSAVAKLEVVYAGNQTVPL